MPCVLNERIKKVKMFFIFGIHGNQSSNIIAKLEKMSNFTE